MRAEIREEFEWNNSAERERAQAILRVAATSIRKRLLSFQGVQHFQQSFEQAIMRRCRFILKAAQVSPRKLRAMSDWEKHRNAVVAETRAQLAQELRESRRIGADLRHTIKSLRAEQAQLLDSLAHLRSYAGEHGYPVVPLPTLNPTKKADGLPNAPGVYFIWNGPRVDYVGQSIRLSQRCRLGHEMLHESHRISFLLFPPDKLDFAECFYIGLLMPPRNFGGRNQPRRDQTL